MRSFSKCKRLSLRDCPDGLGPGLRLDFCLRREKASQRERHGKQKPRGAIMIHTDTGVWSQPTVFWALPPWQTSPHTFLQYFSIELPLTVQPNTRRNLKSVTCTKPPRHLNCSRETRVGLVLDNSDEQVGTSVYACSVHRSVVHAQIRVLQPEHE